jgi:hypothetical protein
MWEWYIPPIYGDLGVVYYCFTHIRCNDIKKNLSKAQYFGKGRKPGGTFL